MERGVTGRRLLRRSKNKNYSRTAWGSSANKAKWENYRMNETVKIYKNTPIRIVTKDGEPWFVAQRCLQHLGNQEQPWTH